MEQYVNGSESNIETDVSPTFNTGDYIGIQRTSASNFRCYRSTDGTTWTALGSGGTFTPPNPGRWGAHVAINPVPFTLEVWEGGNGALPTARACGTP